MDGDWSSAVQLLDVYCSSQIPGKDEHANYFWWKRNYLGPMKFLEELGFSFKISLKSTLNLIS